ncbi:MAG: pyridoxamine 5'-phosphate oxidase family protein [Lachnospiraceae bacterium]|nr:pyridoxamine 5'-phosphate oxidase family protein [Lachnospiraceae bacterium]MBR6155488.1 pyridoxamine 5'-phosphate oxidase family protein [Lachnospiraceae bacterium]MBR6849390.1 pyridoxamine 5'-phosphate oxidase family protein [Lachnospiraceae bacterium]
MDDMKDVISIIERSEAAYFASVDEEGRPEIRALLNLCNPKKYKSLIGKALVQNGEKLELYFTTNTSSKKVARIRNNPNVALYFCEPEKFRGICVSGTVEEVTDQALKESFWQTGWRIYYHLGKTDPDYTVLKVTSTKIEGWYNLGKHIFGEADG